MNCRRRGKPSIGSKQVNKDPSKKGNDVTKKSGTDLVGRDQRPTSPPSQKKGTTQDWSK